MKDDALRRLSVLAATTVLTLGGLVGCAIGDDCAHLASKLNGLAILEERPESATSTGTAHDCDSSDEISFAWRSYRSPIARTEVVAFYEAALVRQEWQAVPNPAVPPGTTRAATGLSCYFKEVDGRFAEFLIDISGSNTDDYTVRVEGPYLNSCQ